MPPPPSIPPCALYLVTPRLARSDAAAFAQNFAAVLAAAPVASALVRLAAGAEADARAIVSPLIAAAGARDCALLLETDARLAARLGADGVHVEGAGAALEEALDSLKPERIVGAGAIAGRDEAMAAGELGADYVMFGEPYGGRPAAPLDGLVDRVAWWAEIFETPCVAYAESIDAAGALARAGADFVALGDAIWLATSPTEAMGLVAQTLARAHAQRLAEAAR